MSKTDTAVKHTPGPWEAYNGHDRALGSWAILAPQPVANRATQVICRTSDDAPADAANAQLIAASPEMFDALMAILMDEEDITPEMRQHIEKVLNKAVPA